MLLWKFGPIINIKLYVIDIYMYVCMHIRMYVRMYIHMYVCMYMYVHMYVCMYVCNIFTPHIKGSNCGT